MTKHLVKPILAGILIGAALYVLPFFFLRGFFFFLLIFFLFRFFFWGRWGRPWGWRGYHGYGGIHPAFADTIRNMSDEEYDTFRKNFDRYNRPAHDEGGNEGGTRDSKR